ncbi:MAG TPA: hypothetical protein DCL80_08555 [Balneola sp.]|jgi:hypothetical protein|nr:hypothetical protein [Balneola sp.]MAO76776.1 hypothetical protein [Balneola sp.]MBF65184.1 hypothetical protein [Balneola sp.]HAH51302.1 hypothetical protein [Balneola sp.]HBZ38618.1 hypothetical protein [Balneola sp.]|tara:strand:+ start:3147 stop:3881 length:735 start_codon:yes stop_codon:yes gene_type:complete
MRLIRALSLLIMSTILSQNLYSQSESEKRKIFFIEDFEKDEIGDLPASWYNQKGEAKPIYYEGELRKTYHYAVEKEGGNKFLRFEGNRGKHMSYPLLNKEEIDIYKTPILSWKFRIHEIPVGANEDDGDKNDAAASVYIAFDLGRVLFKKVPKTIRYTWSSTLPVGTELSKFYGNQKIIVIGTGNNNQGEWQTFERNIVEDYKRLFGDDPPNKPLALLILSDGNNTKSMVKADYDDFKLKSVQN